MKRNFLTGAAATLALAFVLAGQSTAYAGSALSSEVVSRQVTSAVNRRNRAKRQSSSSGKNQASSSSSAVLTPRTTASVTPPAQMPASVPSNLTAETGSSNLISAEEAKNIALRHSGLSSLHFTKVELSREDDYGYIYVYEIEGRNGQMEYEFDIHGETGAVLSYSVEWDD